MTIDLWRRSRPVLWSLLVLIGLALSAQGFAKPAFDSPPERDSAGFFKLNWDGAERFELEQASGPEYQDARIVYRGGDTRTTVSGLPNGEYRFRIREEGAEEWADETVVVVEHHSLGRAFLFFALGAALFVVLILAIARGRRLT
ncbi:MAG: hypothetical protein KFF45_07470 [Thioalkalivibrio sp.]|nr:hypothetical protein [Thioalkalivibrio sp.]